MLNAVSDAYVELSREVTSSEAVPPTEENARTAKRIARANQIRARASSPGFPVNSKKAAPTESGEAVTQAMLEAYSAQLATVKSKRLKAETSYREAAHELESGSAVNLVAAPALLRSSERHCPVCFEPSRSCGAIDADPSIKTGNCHKFMVPDIRESLRSQSVNAIYPAGSKPQVKMSPTSNRRLHTDRSIPTENPCC